MILNNKTLKVSFCVMKLKTQSLMQSPTLYPLHSNLDLVLSYFSGFIKHSTL